MLRVFIVDDMDIVRRQIKRMKLWNDKTSYMLCGEAQNGLEALIKLEAASADVVITDIKMPKVDGLELLSKIHERQLCPCIVLLSDYSDFNYARKGLVLGAFDYLTKPINEEDLSRLLQRAAEYIDSIRYAQERVGKLEEKLLEKVELFYPEEDVRNLIESIKKDEEDVGKHAGRLVDLVYEKIDHDSIKAELILKNIQKNIVSEVFIPSEWFNSFFNPGDLINTGIVKHNNKASYKEAFVEAILNIKKAMNKYLLGKTDSELVNNICIYVLHNIDQQISLKSAADMLYMNKSYVSEIFKQKTGISFIEYLTRIKMERAKKLVRDGGLKAFEIGERLGYKDVEYFSKLFKKYTGLSPTEYRQNCKKTNKQQPKYFGVNPLNITFFYKG